MPLTRCLLRIPTETTPYISDFEYKCISLTTYVAPSRLDTVLSTPESGISAHSIS